MRRESRQMAGWVFPIPVAAVLLAMTPGCGDTAKKPEGAGAGVPTSGQESNRRMEDFMKSQGAKK